VSRLSGRSGFAGEASTLAVDATANLRTGSNRSLASSGDGRVRVGLHLDRSLSRHASCLFLAEYRFMTAESILEGEYTALVQQGGQLPG